MIHRFRAEAMHRRAGVLECWNRNRCLYAVFLDEGGNGLYLLLLRDIRKEIKARIVLQEAQEIGSVRFLCE